MPFDIAVMDEDYKYIKTVRVNEVVAGALFRKLVNVDAYPSLGRAADDKDDIAFLPEEVPALLSDVEKVIAYLEADKLMSAEVKSKCMAFVKDLKEICLIAKREGRSVDFIAGE